MIRISPKTPRIRDAAHLAFVATLPCVICGAEGVHVAHIRMGSLPHGKRPTGLGEKPSDRWTVPLCPAHHTDGPDAQHRQGERSWWQSHGIDPLSVAALIYSHSQVDDHDGAMSVCQSARELILWRK